MSKCPETSRNNYSAVRLYFFEDEEQPNSKGIKKSSFCLTFLIGVQLSKGLTRLALRFLGGTDCAKILVVMTKSCG